MSMPSTYRSSVNRQVNPRLGIYFSIFAAAFASLTIVLAILEQLGYPDRWLRLALVAAPAAFAAVIGIGSISHAPEDYFASGRRVPAVFNGLVIALTALGATGLLAVTGTFYLIGADALCLALGYFNGLLLAAVLLVPYLRKMGAYTVPAYLGRRFESRWVRMLAALLLAVPVLLILVAELRVGAALVKGLVGANRGSLIWPAAVAICITIAPGGMRSLSWSNAAWALIAFIALLVPVAIVSIALRNLPFPQLTYGSLLPDLAQFEAAAGLPITHRLPLLRFSLPDFGLANVTNPFMGYFGASGRCAFVMAAVSIMMGVAVMPSLLTRAGTSPSVREARKSMSWAVVILGVVLLTLPAIAVFTRYLVLTDVVGRTPDRLPEWLAGLVQTGQATVDGQAPKVTLQSLAMRRDVILLILPALAGLPTALTYVAASGIVAAALAGASAKLLTLANMIGEDLIHATGRFAQSNSQRLAAARGALAAAGAVAAWLALQWTVDPLRLVLWAFSLAAATALPVLIASIWWKRVTRSGAFFGMLGGFTATLAAIVGDALGPAWFGIDSTLAGVLGVPAGIMVMIGVSLLTAAPGREVRELVREIRTPGGETIHDRETRLARGARPAG